MRLCSSCQLREGYERYDARNIYIGRHCDPCWDEDVKHRYRQDVLEDPNYEANEPIEPDDPDYNLGEAEEW